SPSPLPSEGPPASPPTSRPATESMPSRQLEIAFDSLRLTNGRLGMVDQTVKPFFAGGLSALDVEAHNFVWPALSFANLRVATTTPEKGTIRISGSGAPGNGSFEVKGEQIA